MKTTKKLLNPERTKKVLGPCPFCTKHLEYQEIDLVVTVHKNYFGEYSEALAALGFEQNTNGDFNQYQVRCEVCDGYGYKSIDPILAIRRWNESTNTNEGFDYDSLFDEVEEDIPKPADFKPNLKKKEKTLIICDRYWERD